jgi:hypothetical protein
MGAAVTVNEMIPPTLPSYAAKSDFVKTGESFLRSSRRLCGLRPDDRVLDVGCGVGRFAAPLTQFLRENGSYDGLDVVPESIEWCVETISTRYGWRHSSADVLCARSGARRWSTDRQFCAREGGVTSSRLLAVASVPYRHFGDAHPGTPALSWRAPRAVDALRGAGDPVRCRFTFRTRKGSAQVPIWRAWRYLSGDVLGTRSVRRRPSADRQIWAAASNW